MSRNTRPYTPHYNDQQAAIEMLRLYADARLDCTDDELTALRAVANTRATHDTVDQTTICLAHDAIARARDLPHSSRPPVIV